MGTILLIGIAGLFVVGILGGTVTSALTKNKTNTTAETVKTSEKEETEEHTRSREKEREAVKTEDKDKVVEETPVETVATKTVEQYVKEKMSEPGIKKLVGKNKEKATYLSAILTNAATKQFKNGKSVEDLMNNENFNTKIIPSICTKIDKFLSVKSLTEEKLDKFFGIEESNITTQLASIKKKLRVLEKQLLENKSSFMDDAEMYEAGLDESISNISVNSHMSYVMETIEGLKKNSKKLNDKMKNIETKLEEHDYDLKMLEKLNLVDLKDKVEDLEKSGLTESDIVTVFVHCIDKYVESAEFKKIVEEVAKNTQTKVTYRITPTAKSKIVAEIYNTIINEGTIDDKTLKDTVSGVVKDIIENKLQVKNVK